MIVVGIGNKTFIQQVSHLYISNSSEVADLINLSDNTTKKKRERTIFQKVYNWINTYK